MSLPQREVLKRTVEALEASWNRYPENEKILYQLALSYSQLGRYDEQACEIYRKAGKQFPQDVKIQKAVSILETIEGTSKLPFSIRSLKELDDRKLSRDIDKLYALTREYPDSAFIHRALANLFLLRGDERESIHHYRCCLALGYSDLAGMCDYFEHVRRLGDLSGYVGAFFAELYQRLNQPLKANKVFQAFLNYHNPERVVLDKYSEFLQRQIENLSGVNNSEYCLYLRQLIRVCLLRGNASEALTWARQLTPEQITEDPRLAKDLARKLISMEDYRLAFEYLSRIDLDDDAKGILNDMTVHLEKKGELDTAVYVLQYINENDELARESKQYFHSVDPDDLMIEIETELQMAEIHWKNRRWEQAFERYLHVLHLGYDEYKSLLEPLDLLFQRINKVDVHQLVFLANFFAEKREWKRCLEYARKALELDNTDVEMSKRVIQSCERILVDEQSNYEVALIYGEEHLRLGNIEHAIQEFRRCAEIPEYQMKANKRLAIAHFHGGDLIAALEHFQNLPFLEPEDLNFLYDLTIAFGNQAQYKEAFEAAKMIREYDEEFRDIVEKSNYYEEKMNENNLGFVVDTKMRELIGDHSIGRYKYIEKIGSGGMGVVHKVIDLKSKNVLAMKILREGLSSSGKAIDRFFREARIAATLRHKNIVNITDYNISNNFGQSYIAMEFVDGPSLRDIIEEKFAQTVDITDDDIKQSLLWTSQLCDALDATHQKGIIHRDIKPDNILIGADNFVKITDFGIVHIEEATFTPTGALIGTPRYMSPEQVHGGRIDNRSDIYAVGIIMYEQLIGSPPFISGDISYQQVNVAPTSPKEICPVIPQAVDRIIMKCLEKAPADRYQDAVELKRDIDEAYVYLGGNRSDLNQETQATATGSPLTEQSSEESWEKPIEPKPLAPSQNSLRSMEEDHIETPASFLKEEQMKETVDLESDLDDIESSMGLDTDLDIS